MAEDEDLEGVTHKVFFDIEIDGKLAGTGTFQSLQSLKLLFLPFKT